MAGASIDITHNSKVVEQALQKLERVTDDLEPMMMEMAEYLHERTWDHFDKEEDPDGTPWAALQASTLERKQKKKVPVNKVLHGKSLHLRDLIFPFWSESESGVSTAPGTDAYAATQQFGDLSRNIPARPFLGFGYEDLKEILDMAESEYQALLDGL